MPTCSFFRHALLCSATVLCLLAPLPAAAVVPLEKNRQLLQGDKAHAESAFYFAERDNWYEAVQHANKARSAVFRDYMQWRALLQEDSGYRFDAYQRFLSQNRNWPYESRLVLRAEDKLFTGDAGSVSKAELQRWFATHPPISGKGKLVLAELRGNGAEATRLIREAWVDGDYDSTQEKMIMLRYGKKLRQQDYIDRTDRLIWQGKYSAAERMFFALPDGHKNLFEARIKLALNKPGVNQAIARVPSSLRNDPGLLYERMRWRYREGLEDGVEEILLQTPAKVPFPEKWWRTRHIQVREAIQKGRPAHALKLLANHGQVDGIGQADALWLQGWIHLVYLEQPAKAFPFFSAMEKAVSYPVSKSRGFYWMGRAAEAMGQREQAQQYYTQGAVHDTTYYGQLAALKVNSRASVRLPQTARPTAQQLQQFHADSRVKAVYMLAELGRYDDAQTFIRHLMDVAKNQSDAVMTAELGTAIKRTDYAVQASKDAMQHHIVLPQTSYPYYRIGFRPAIEEPLMWAITRQESLFNPTAESSANAKGLMQILPSTAREVARKNDIGYQPSQLGNATYNLRLGSLYLGELIGNFDGSYILAIAAYNAGPGRARQWVGEFGRPSRNLNEAIDWVERIPYSETRNYVQRVLENLQVYRSIVAPNANQGIQLDKDLTR